jgi:hypothetical protein
MPHAKVNDPWNWQSYRALLIWIVGLLVLVTAVFAVKDALLPSSTPATTVAIPGTPTVNPILAAAPDSDIRLVDVSVLAEGNLPALDIKVRNVGDKIAILKKANVHVADYEIFPIFGCATYAPPPSPLAFSAKYDVDLRNSTTQAINLSQSVSPNDVDRFKIVLGTAPTHHGSWIGSCWFMGERWGFGEGHWPSPSPSHSTRYVAPPISQHEPLDFVQT